ncbi:nuclear transport factor 2 family protein [Dyadobacter sp. NIV53]|uniref:nuclear transport factor 2 family protein n=1 Tax=Dyadobacter sp. NIV53 TaxID=2861765 RepID=UPI001C847F38|nr:nuclear transport factor 2 family protein [Dyadobacter sp. NIV53]
MKNLVYLLLLFLPAIASYSQPSYTQPADAMDCSNIFFKALLEEDHAILESLLSNDFSISGFQGQEVDRNFILQSVTRGYLRIDSGMLSGSRARNYGDVGVITGTWSARGQLPEQ